jgi:hypothetical protein
MQDVVRLSYGTRSRFQPMRRNPDAYFPGYPAKLRLNYISATRLVRLIIRKGI